MENFRDNPCDSGTQLPQGAQTSQQWIDYEATHQEQMATRQLWMDEHAPFLGIWLWRYFWITIITLVPALISNDSVVALLPALEIPGMIGSLLCSLISLFILWKLGTVQRQYRIASILVLVSTGLSLLLLLFVENVPYSQLIGVVLFLILCVGLLIVAAYFELTAHRLLLSGVDDKLSARWRKLWRWTVGLVVTIVVTVLLIAKASSFGGLRLGFFVFFACLIGFIVVSIARLVSLYQTANRFRGYTPQPKIEEELP